MSGANAGRTVIKEMGLTPADFSRGLPRVLGDDALTLEPEGAAIAVAGGAVLRVAFRERPPRRIAGLTLPVAEVTLRFEGFADGAAETAILERFERAFQRGGG